MYPINIVLLRDQYQSLIVYPADMYVPVIIVSIDLLLLLDLVGQYFNICMLLGGVLHVGKIGSSEYS